MCRAENFLKKRSIDFFDNRTKSAREIWRQMQATRYHILNPKLKINTVVSGTAEPPEVVFKFADDSEVGPRVTMLVFTVKA